MTPAETVTPEPAASPRMGFDEPMHPAQIAAMRRLTISERFVLGLRFLRSARAWLESGIRARHPDWDDAQIAAEIRRAVTHAGN